MTKEQFELYLKSIECKIEASAIWNAAIEKAVQEIDSKSHISLPLRERVKMLKIK